jgi:hypothetical protein
MSGNIIIITEGLNPENANINSIEKNFFSEGKRFRLIYDAEIYQLWRKMIEYPDGEYINILEIIKKRAEEGSGKIKGRNQKVLQELEEKDVSEIYLFFDYDCNSSTYSVEDLQSMLDYFDNETENGKLFISYPMVEAFCDVDDFKNKVVDKSIVGKKYKKMVHESTCIKNLNQINKAYWERVVLVNHKKAHHIIHEEYTIPDHRIGQNEIFDGQLERFVPHNVIAVLSAFPMFLIDYFGENLQSKLTS